MTLEEAVELLQRVLREGEEDVSDVLRPRLARMTGGQRLQDYAPTNPEGVLQLAEMIQDLVDQEPEINDLVLQREAAGLEVERRRRAALGLPEEW